MREMPVTREFSAAERAALWAVSAVGFLALNVVFGWAVFLHPDMVQEAMANPLSLVFVMEALVLTGLLAYLLHKWQVTRLHWIWFVVLALVGSLAFALPIAVLWHRSSRSSAA